MPAISNNLTRRRAMQIAVAAGCCGGPALASGPRIDQITDPLSTAAKDMFRFAPDLVVTEPGTEIIFLNSRGEHTVHSSPQLWPDGVPPVGISAKKEAAVLLPVEGLYGFRCRRHGQYGMVMLVVAGNVSDLEFVPDRIARMKAKPREKEAFTEVVARYMALHL
mgnify:FL=1